MPYTLHKVYLGAAQPSYEPTSIETFFNPDRASWVADDDHIGERQIVQVLPAGPKHAYIICCPNHTPQLSSTGLDPEIKRTLFQRIDEISAEPGHNRTDDAIYTLKVVLTNLLGVL
jgi:hypothetical protein